MDAMLDGTTLRHSIADVEDLLALLEEVGHGNDLLTNRAICGAWQTLWERLQELRIQQRQSRLF